MISPAKLEANRRNAQQSIGPKTPEGKAKASHNSLQHGLTAQSFTLLPTEDPALYQAYISETLAAYKPRSALATALVTRLAQLLWQLGRLPAALSQLIQHKMAEHPGSTPEQVLALAFCDGTKPNAFDRLQRYEAALDRAFAKTLQHLRQLVSENEPTEAPPMPLQDEPTAPPITPSPTHPFTPSSPAAKSKPTTHPLAPSSSVQSEPTAPPSPAPAHTLTPSQRLLLHAATSRVDLGDPLAALQA